MGTTTEIKETNIGHALIGKTCQECNRTFTNKDILNYGNWAVEFDTSNDVKLEDNKVKNYGWNLTIWIRHAYHSSCDRIGEEDKKEEVKEKVGLYGINEVMEGLIESQRRAMELSKKK